MPDPIIPPSEAEQSYARLKPTLARVDLGGASMRGVSVERVAARLLELQPEYEALPPALAEHFKASIMDPYREAVAALPDLIAALFYTDAWGEGA